MCARTLVAVAVLAGLTFVPRCANRAGYGTLQMGAWKDTAGATAAVAKAEAARTAPPVEPVPAPVPAAAVPADPFRDTIRPILSARCGQCHDPGGRMYARLPFDDPQVVSSHSAGVLRRLKGEDRAAMEKWLAGLAPASGQR
jgi:mono/diheme cytochrome c family protein